MSTKQKPYKLLEEFSVLKALNNLKGQMVEPYRSVVDDCIDVVERMRPADLMRVPLPALKEMLSELQLRQKNLEAAPLVPVFELSSDGYQWLTLCQVQAKSLLSCALADSFDYIDIGRADVKVQANVIKMDQISLGAARLEYCQSHSTGCNCPRKPMNDPAELLRELSLLLGVSSGDNTEWLPQCASITPFDVLFGHKEQFYELTILDEQRVVLHIPDALIGAMVLPNGNLSAQDAVYDDVYEAMLALLLLREVIPLGHVWRVNKPEFMSELLCEKLSKSNVLDLLVLAERWSLPLKLNNPSALSVLVLDLLR